MAVESDEQLIKQSHSRNVFRSIINAMQYFAANPKGEVGFWGQPIDLYKKSREIRQKQKIDKNYTPVEYVNKHGKPIKFEKYKYIC